MPYLERGDARIYYESKGDTNPETIVFAHGAGGNAGIWFNQIASFSPSFRTVAFDHRCFARSTLEPAVNVHQFRDDLLALLDHLDVERAHLVGQSMGGFTVLRCALDAPERVATLTLSCTTGGIINPNPTPAMQDLTSSSGRDTAGISASMSQATQRDAALMQLYESINNFNTEFTWDKLRTLLSREDVVQLEQLKDVACPTLIFAGREDPLFPPALLETYVPHFKNAVLEVIEDAGHSPYFEQPAVFNRRLKQHITST